MKIACAVFCILSVLGVTLATDSGQYIPKGFYTIDEDGNQSPVFLINGESEKLLHRAKRQVFSSSSSSSSSSGPGGKTFFSQTSNNRVVGRSGKPKSFLSAKAGFVDKYGRVYYKAKRGQSNHKFL